MEQPGHTISQSRGGGGSTASIPHFVRLDFAHATQSVLYVMAAIMAVAAIAGFIGLRAGVQEETDESEPVPMDVASA
jgi:hypothetical protein